MKSSGASGDDNGLNWLVFELLWRDFFRFRTSALCLCSLAFLIFLSSSHLHSALRLLFKFSKIRIVVAVYYTNKHGMVVQRVHCVFCALIVKQCVLSGLSPRNMAPERRMLMLQPLLALVL